LHRRRTLIVPLADLLPEELDVSDMENLIRGRHLPGLAAGQRHRREDA